MEEKFFKLFEFCKTVSNNDDVVKVTSRRQWRAAQVGGCSP